MSEQQRTWDILGTRLGRRQMIRGSVIGSAGLAAAALIGCGDDDDDETVATAPAPVTTTTDDSTTTTEEEVPAPQGQLIEDPNLPFPLAFPEPAKLPKRGGIMTVAATWDTSTMDTTKSAAGGTITVPNMVYNRLIGMRGGPDVNLDQIELEPELAKSWERSPDGLTWTFNLRDDVNWQNVAPLNGRKFVAADLKQAYERYASEGVHKSIWANAASMEAPDDTTFKINMSRATADFIRPVASRYQTIFPPELVASGDIDGKAIGTGPMIMTEAVQSDHVSFDANPDYFEREVLLDGFEFKIMPDHASRLAGFRAGQFEYAYSVAPTLLDIEALLGSNPDIQINMVVRTSSTAPFAMNMQNPKFVDERVRQGIALAIDNDLIIDVIYQGMAKTLPFYPWNFVFDSEPAADSGAYGPWARYDPQEAKQLLAAAGYEDGLEIESIYYAYSSTNDRIAEILVDIFRDSGITLNSSSVDYTEFNSQWVGAKLPEASTVGWLPVGFDADNWFFNASHSESPGNRWQIKDAQLDEWAIAQQIELDPERRREIHRKMWDYANETMFWPPLPGAFDFQVYQPWVRGIRFGGPFLSNSSYYDWGDQVAEAWLDK